MSDPLRSKQKLSPCYGCPDKEPACSGHCKKPEYLKYRAEQERIKAAKKAYRPPAWMWPEASRKGFAQGRSEQ